MAMRDSLCPPPAISAAGAAPTRTATLAPARPAASPQSAPRPAAAPGSASAALARAAAAAAPLTTAARPAAALAKPALLPARPAAAHGPPAAPHGASWQIAAGPGQTVVLMPGQMSFSTANAQMRTLLGSCVSITLWHPGRRCGGMCHYLLPQRTRRVGDPLDGRYGDEAVQAMVERLTRLGTQPSEYVAHLYGGADTLPDGNTLKFNVGERNIEHGWKLIDQYGFQLEGIDVGEDVPRTVSLDLGSGEVDMRRGSGRAPANPGLAR